MKLQKKTPQKIHKSFQQFKESMPNSLKKKRNSVNYYSMLLEINKISNEGKNLRALQRVLKISSFFFK